MTTPVLKLMCELCQNRSQRLQFDVQSPAAILLFQQCSKIICEYGKTTLHMHVHAVRAGNAIAKLAPSIAADDYYARVLKGVSVCFGILKATLAGGYVNFGIFALYGDQALQNALDTFIKLLTLVPDGQLLVSVCVCYIINRITCDL
jgi:exportin-7